MDSQNENEIIFKKLTNKIISNSKPEFSQTEEKEIFFCSDNKLIKYNYSTSFLTARYKISPSKIVEKFLVKEDAKAFCLLKGNTQHKENEFIEYNLNTKEITNSFTFSELNQNEKIQNFAYSSQLDTVILITNYAKILHIKEKDGKFILSKQRNIFDTTNLKIANNNKKQIIHFTEISSDGKIVMFPFENKLITHNLINSESFTIEFKKHISCGIFLSDDNAAVGDSAGKIHFISNLNKKDNKFSIATRHWHSHRVNTLESDKNGDYLYSAGKEGVVVIWNLKSEEKSFLPRLNAEIHNLKISHNSQILSAICGDNSLKTIDLFNFQVVNEFSGLSLNYSADEKNIKQFNIKSESFLLFFNESSEKVQIFNINSGRILSSNCVFSKNFVSNTEREQINCRRLKNVEIEKGNFEHLVTYEEITDDKDPNFLISYLKFWRLSTQNFKRDFSIELICAAENPHGNEKITQIEFTQGKCVTFSKSHFKVWERSENSEISKNFVCGFVGSYKKEICKSLYGCYSEKENSIYAIHDSKYMIKWDLTLQSANLSKIFVFEENSEFKLLLDNINDLIFIYDTNKLICFSSSEWEVLYEENYENFVIKSLLKSKDKIYLTISKTESKDEYLIYSLNSKNENKLEVDNCFYLRKKNLIYLNVWRNVNSLVLVNSNFDVIITKKNSLLGTKQLKKDTEELSDEEDEMKVDLFQDKKLKTGKSI